MKGSADNKREVYFDFLRIIAAFSVVMLHSAAQFWYTLDIFSREWIIANSYDAVFRFGVPIFVMISGALFLNSKYSVDIKRLYTHNILRYVVIYLLWCSIYGLWDARTFQFAEVGWKPYVREMLGGRYHLWFLPMIIGIYLLLPVLKSWVNSAEKKNLQYFLILFLVFQVGAETLRALTVTDELHQILDKIQIEMVCSYVGYFVWGYYLIRVGVSQKIRNLFYIAVIPAVAGNIILGNHLAHSAGKAVGSIYDSFGIFTFVIATALFLFFSERFGESQLEGRRLWLLQEVSKDTLGIYLLHIGVMEVLIELGIHSMMIPNVVGIPVFALLCFVLCMLITALLRRIPYIGKYLC